jgi:UDP-N-acetylmuramoylalanine--D-glutamate ligase
VQLGGNIGTPILALDPPAKDRYHIVECSSYQIDLAPSLDPGIGVLLNMSPDHLDRHGTMENYAAIKARLLEGSDYAVCGIDDDIRDASPSALEEGPGRVSRRSR